MTFQAAHAGNACAPVRARDFHRACAMLKRFDAGLRPRVAALVGSHAYFEDLMWSFPAVLHQLALACEGDARAENARVLVRSGASLKMIAAALGLPMWTRALQVEALGGALPVLPASKTFECRIANHIPNKGKLQRRWLAIVSAAYQACDEDFALWVAKTWVNVDTDHGAEKAAVMGLYAWHSARPLLEVSQPITRPWKAEMGFEEVRGDAMRWLQDLEIPLYAHVREGRIASANPEPVVMGIEFVRLRTPDDLREEGRAMNHCVGGYVSNVAKGCSLIYSLRENGRRIATLEVRFRRTSFGRPVHEQLRGPENAEPPHHVWAAMHMWLAGWRDPASIELPCGCTTAPNRAVWLRLWKPYWKAKGLTHFLRLAPGCDAIGPAVEALWR